MRQAAARLERIRNAFRTPDAAGAYAKSMNPSWDQFVVALDDDFDTPAALAVMHEWVAGRELTLLKRALDVFGLGSVAYIDQAPLEIVAIAERRVAARAERDFETSDRLRDELAAAGWEMRDRSDGYDLVRI